MNLPSRFREPLGAAIAAVAVALFCMLLLRFEPMLFWHDDNQLGALAAFRDVARAFDEGQWPLLSLYSWYAGNFAGELQLGTFSLFVTPLILLIWKLGLTLPMTAAAYTIAHLMVLAAGTYILARHKGVAVPLTGVVVAAACLNGWNMAWSGATWLSLLASFAWLPWAWWALERALAPERGFWRFLPAAFFLYLLAAAGWPPTVVMAGLVTLMVLGRAGLEARAIKPLWPVFAAWTVAVAVVLPAYWLFWDHVRHSARSAASGLIFEWLVPIHGWLGAFYPALGAPWRVYQVDKLHLPIELANGLVPAVALVALLLLRRQAVTRRAGWELGLLGVGMALAMSPGFALFRWSFRWLPLVHLLMGLVAAMALTAWWAERRADDRLNLGTWALGLVGVSFALSFLWPVLPPWLGVSLLGVAAVWALVEAVPSLRRFARWAPVAVAVASLWLTYRAIPTAIERPLWPIPEAIRAPAPLDPAVRYMALVHRDDYFGPQAFESPFGLLVRPGCTFMYAGLEFVNGYSPLGPMGLSKILLPGLNGYLRHDVTAPLLERETGPGGLLQLMAVDGLVLGQVHRADVPGLVARGWRLVAAGPEGAVLHREGPPSPRVRTGAQVRRFADEDAALSAMLMREGPEIPLVMTVEPGEAEGVRRYAAPRITPVERTRNHEAVDVQAAASDQPSLVVFSRAWYPGFVAELDGRPLPVRRLNLAMPAVELPPGASGRLVLAYRPWPLLAGGAVSLGTIGLLLCVAIAGLLRRALGRGPALP